MDTYMMVMDIFTFLTIFGAAAYWAWFIYYLFKSRNTDDSSETTETKTADELGQPV